MSKRAVFVAVLFFAGLVALLFWLARPPREPVFEGRKLSDWLYHHVSSSAAMPPYNSQGWHKAEEALRTIGTNGISTLLRMIRARDASPWRLKVIRIAQRHSWSVRYVRYRSGMYQNEEAEYAFEVLGTNAASAVPELIKIYEENISPSSQRCAAMALGHIGPRARTALPVLIKNFTHTNYEVRFRSVSAVMYIGGEPAVVAPALAGALKDPNVNVRWNALIGLQRLGPRARSAVPEILKMWNDPGMLGSNSITQLVETTLWRIVPERAYGSILVEAATPMITNGVASEAVKFVFRGKREALIRPGESVPVWLQHWSSDPRPRLTMYRGSATSDENDHFLGHFEVLGVPDSPNVNISTLCIIAEGNIYLAARNNQGDRFLEIRRVAAPVAQ